MTQRPPQRPRWATVAAGGGVFAVGAWLAVAFLSPPGSTEADTTGIGSRATPSAQSQSGANGRAIDRKPGVSPSAVAAIFAVADHNPLEALQRTAGDDAERRALRLAIAKRWATDDMLGAARWADAQPNGEWQPALAAVLAGAVTRVADAVALVEQLIDRNPDRTGDYGQCLVAALAKAKAFPAAAQWAAAAPPEFLPTWIHDAYFHWGREDSAAAVQACADLAANDTRTAAMKALIAGWAERDPAAVANYALELQAADLRTEAISHALPQWVARDPDAAAVWLVQQELLPEFDAGTMALATQREVMRDRPALAVKWAASIVEPTLRANTLRAVAFEWAAHDPVAFSTYLETGTELLQSDREILRQTLIPTPDS